MVTQWNIVSITTMMLAALFALLACIAVLGVGWAAIRGKFKRVAECAGYGVLFLTLSLILAKVLDIYADGPAAETAVLMKGLVGVFGLLGAVGYGATYLSRRQAQKTVVK